MRLKLIGCEILYRELCQVVARSRNVVDLEFLPKGLHDIGQEPMRERVQALIDAAEGQKYEAVLLGYGLCNHGTTGVQARSVPVVIPRAHDCVTLFLGSRERYVEYFRKHPGTFFTTTGWVERSDNPAEVSRFTIQHRTGMESSLEDLVEKYGEENARYIYGILAEHASNCNQFTFIEMGVEPDAGAERHTRSQAEARGWTFEKVRGDMGLLQRLVDGPWIDDDFLTVPPGHRVCASFDHGVIAAEEAPQPEAGPRTNTEQRGNR
jgi:hypothetical protein